jgi:hypothetical protein
VHVHLNTFSINREKQGLTTGHNMAGQILETEHSLGEFTVVTKLACFIENEYIIKKMKRE